MRSWYLMGVPVVVPIAAAAAIIIVIRIIT